MDIAVLELLADGSRCLTGAGPLKFDDLNEIGDTTHVILLISFAGEVLDGDGHRRVRFLLSVKLAPMILEEYVGHATR